MSEITLDKKTHINEIINNFNFEKVHQVMEALNWKWFCYSPDGIGTGMFVPTIEQLKSTAIDLLSDIYEDRDYDTTATGGFTARRLDDFLELSFIVSSWTSDSVNEENSRYEILKKNKTRKKKINNIENK